MSSTVSKWKCPGFRGESIICQALGLESKSLTSTGQALALGPELGPVRVLEPVLEPEETVMVVGYPTRHMAWCQ